MQSFDPARSSEDMIPEVRRRGNRRGGRKLIALSLSLSLAKSPSRSDRMPRRCEPAITQWKKSAEHAEGISAEKINLTSGK